MGTYNYSNGLHISKEPEEITVDAFIDHYRTKNQRVLQQSYCTD